MRTRQRTVRWPLLGVAIAATLVVAACGGDDGEEAAATPDAEETAAEEEPSAEESEGGEAADTLRVGIMGECEGPFGAFHEDVVAGAITALVEKAGSEVNSPTSALEGFTGGQIGDTPIELVGIGCGDDTADRALQEIRTLVEENGANMVIGPLSGDEGIAIAQYAADHPDVTFVNGIAGAQDATMQVQSPNFFRFNGDGAQWNAGIGDILYNEAGWKTAAVIADDYGFGWTSAAGFVADFCAAGGEVTNYVFPPLGTTDYSSFIAQLPDPGEVDGYFWVVGGTGTNASLEAFVNAKGELNGEQHAGNLFFNPALAETIGDGVAGAYVGGFASLPGDVSTPEITAYQELADSTWESLAGGTSAGEPAPASQALLFGFGYGYYAGMTAYLEALEAVDGDLSDDQAAVREYMQTNTFDLPFGPVTLDERNQAIVDTFVAQLQLDPATGEVVQKTVAIVPGVDQTFGGTFSPDTAPPERDNTSCEPRELPWQGNAIPVVDGVPQN